MPVRNIKMHATHKQVQPVRKFFNKKVSYVFLWHCVTVGRLGGDRMLEYTLQSLYITSRSSDCAVVKCTHGLGGDQMLECTRHKFNLRRTRNDIIKNPCFKGNARVNRS